MMVAQTNHEFSRLKEKVEILNGERGDRNKAALRRSDLSQIQTLLAFLRQNGGDMTATIAAMQQSIVSVQAALNTAQQAISDLNIDLGVVQSALSDAETAISTLQDDLETLQTGLDDLVDQVQGIETDLSDLKVAAAAVSIPALSSTPISSAPTDADFNTLLSDLTNVRQALSQLQAAIS